MKNNIKIIDCETEVIYTKLNIKYISVSPDIIWDKMLRKFVFEHNKIKQQSLPKIDFINI